MKKWLILSLACMFCLSAYGCGGAGSSPDSASDSSASGSDSSSSISDEPGIVDVPYGERIPQPEDYLLDGFDFGKGGFTESEFYICNTRWGYNNNGVKGENVGFTDDGIAVLKAYGDLTDNPNYKRSGACLLSRQYLGPGLIEVAMKVMPRLGGCTAIWPFYNGTNEETGEYQYQEMDIEIPAGADAENAATFEKVMNTNYASDWREDAGGAVRSTKTETLTPANDGAWHKYSIRWETSPHPRIRYYVDGVLTSDTDDSPDGYKAVSDADAPLQIGVWFPDGWAGDRDFDEAYALVDWVTYRPYDQPYRKSRQPETQTGVYHISLYPLNPIDPGEINYISNGDFTSTSDTDQTGAEKYAWGGDFSPELVVDDGKGGKALKLSSGQKATQTITGVYGKARTNDAAFGSASYFYEYAFTGTFAAEGGCKAAVTIEFLDKNGAVIPGSAQSLELSGNSQMNLKVQSADGSQAMRVTLRVEEGSGTFTDLKMAFTGLKQS